jgi:hypothetical protein
VLALVLILIVPIFVFIKMELIQNAFEQGLVPGIVIVIYLIINKIITIMFLLHNSNYL